MQNDTAKLKKENAGIFINWQSLRRWGIWMPDQVRHDS